MLALLWGQIWVETTPGDFLDGEFDPLLYASKRLVLEGDPADSGAVEFYPRFDANGDGFFDLVAATGDVYYQPGYAYIVYGTDTGYSTPDSQAFRIDTFPSDSGGNSDMADLNLDGYPELIHSGWGTGVCRIFWGTPTGPDPTNYTELPNGNAEAVYVYDLDRDSYLDIILAGDDGYLYVYWGEGYDPATMYDPSRRSRVYLSTVGHNIEVADLNKDGYPDVIVPTGSAFSAKFTIVWGDGDRDLTNNNTWSSSMGSWWTHGLTLGDFNRDGWIDIVATRYASSSWFNASAAYIYWNQGGSFDDGNRTQIQPGDCYGGSAAYDFDGDGWLDLVFFRGQAGVDEKHPLKAYFNTRTSPYFDDSHSQDFGLEGWYSGGFVWDFNNDGKVEIYANNGCGYGLYSYVYWGVHMSGGTLVYDSVEKFRVPDNHHGGFREPGNVYDRSGNAQYVSGVFNNPSAPYPYQTISLTWVAFEDSAEGAYMEMEARVSEDGSSWSSWFSVPNGNPVPAPFPFKFAQYRATFHWRNPAVLPWLERVVVEFLDPLFSDASESRTEGGFSVRGGEGLLWLNLPEGEAQVYDATGRLVRAVAGPGSFKLALKPGVYAVRCGGKVLKAAVR